jgi:DNA-binding LacI/PurR family transcriptional regulator
MTRDGAEPQRVRLRDVAIVAGVSQPTVSRSLRDDPQISERTRAHVRQIAEQLGYVPNAAAQNLALRRSQTLGLMVPDVTDPVHGQIVSGFEDEATRQGYVLLISNFRYESNLEHRGLRALISNQAAGIAVFGGVVDPALVLHRNRDRNFVFVGPENLGSLDRDPYPSTIQANDAAGVRAAVEAAVRHGYRAFGYLDGPGVASNIRRRTAAASALEAASANPPRVYKSAWNDFTTVARKIVQDRRDLVLCFDDQRALKLLSALHRLGARVPLDIGIIGFDDIPFASLCNPPLSTVAVPYEQMGQMACTMLIEQLASGAAAEPISVDVQLVLRGSTSNRMRQPANRTTDRPV